MSKTTAGLTDGKDETFCDRNNNILEFDFKNFVKTLVRDVQKGAERFHWFCLPPLSYRRKTHKSLIDS